MAAQHTATPELQQLLGFKSIRCTLLPAAVKCNPEPMMLAMLAALGAGFDCASVMELEAAEALGVAQERVIFANPCKKPADFR
jgi:diaminopimelate decarboxylase